VQCLGAGDRVVAARLVITVPSVAKQACGRLVNRARTSAITPAVSSCRVTMDSMSSHWSKRIADASRPTTPNIRRTLR